MSTDPVMVLINRVLALESRVAGLEQQELPRAIAADTYNDSVARLLGTDTDGGVRVDHIEAGNITGAGEGDIAAADDMIYQGDLTAVRGGVSYPQSPVTWLQAQLTSTSWDGDAKLATDDGTIDLSAVFGVPAGIKAVYVMLGIQDASANQAMALGPYSSYVGSLSLSTQVANQYIYASGWVPCDNNGDIYAQFYQQLDNVILEVWGYSI